MRKKLFISLSIAVTVIAAFVSGCGQESGSIRITASFEEDVDNDGSKETITISSTNSDDPDKYLTKLQVSGNSGTHTESIEDHEYESSYIIRTPSGKVCLLVSLIDNVAYNSKMYSFDGIRPVEQHNLGHITGVSGTNITEEGGIDAFGAWHYSLTYKLKHDLSLERGEPQIIMDYKEPLHTKSKLPVELLTEGVYTKDYIEAGIDIIPIATDGSSYLKFMLDDGREGRILFSGPEDDSEDIHYDNYLYIDGRSEYKYFDNIEYTDMWY